MTTKRHQHQWKLEDETIEESEIEKYYECKDPDCDAEYVRYYDRVKTDCGGYETKFAYDFPHYSWQQ